VTKRLTFAVPGDLATPTGGYAYDRRVVVELRKQGWHVDVLNIGDSFPRPSASELAKARSILTQTPTEVPLVIDGLAFGVMDECANSLAQSHALVALVHHPLALETGLAPKDAAILAASERVALAQVRHTITTSAPTADILTSDYDVAPDKITVAPPGNDPMPPAIPSTDGICRLLTVGSIVPRKGYDVLIEAMAQIAGLPWRLTIIGDPTRDLKFTSALKEAVKRAGLSEKVSLAGSVSDEALATAYGYSDAFVTASHFEGYGMAVTTAIACGLPIVATSGGALAQTVGGAGLLVAPNDATALANALRSVIADAMVRDRLRANSLEAGKLLPTWSETATCFATVIESVR